MSTQVICTELTLPWFTVNAMAFLPSIQGPIKSEWAIFTHGYTSHKGDCLNWATRLCESGVPCLIFDQPGHYLGSFHEISGLEDFQLHSHELFAQAYQRLHALLEQHLGGGHFPKLRTLILGGHSLGAFSAIRALELESFRPYELLAVGIGIGIGQRQATHIFETAFYEKTLAIRRQLVSPHLDPKSVFSWLKTQKESLSIMHKRIHLITGEDDIVVGHGGMEAFIEVLERNQNIVSWDKPKRLPHHEPGLATAHLYSFLKNHFTWA